MQTGGNEYQLLEDGYVILLKDVSYKDIDYEITDVDEDIGRGKRSGIARRPSG